MATWASPALPARWAGTALPAFVGRGRELDVLQGSWDAARRGHRQVVVVGGEPGAGKSRLVAEVASSLHGRGASVLLGACVEELAAPYQPFVEPLEALLAAGSGGQLDLPPDEAARVMDRLAALLGRGGPDPRGPPPRRRYQRDLYDAAACAVRTAAGQRPLVLVLEDLHLAGAATLQLLGHVVEHTAGSRLLLLLTQRTTSADCSVELARALTALYRLDAVRRLDLGGLETEDVVTYLIRQTGVAPSVARARAPALRAATAGNPFFLRELLRDLQARDAVSQPLQGGPAPTSVRDTLRGRLERLSPRERHILEVAAVVGDEVDVSTVSAAQGCSPEQTLAAIDAAVGLGLLAAPHGDGGVVRFPHALARRTFLDLMPSVRLAAAHAQVAAVLEQRVPLTDALVQRLAHHFAGAQALGHGSSAVRYLLLAAAAADRSLAHRDAAALYERAAGLSDDPEQQDELRLAAGHSYVRGADFGRAFDVYERVASQGVPGLRIHAAIGYEVASWHTGAGRGRRAVALLEAEVRRADPDRTPATSVRALAGLGRALVYTGRSDEGWSLCEAALVQAREMGDDELLAEVLNAFMGHGLVPSASLRTLEISIELSALAEQTGTLVHLAGAAYNRSILSYLLGDPTGLDAAQADLARAARITGEPAWQLTVQVIDYSRRLVAGDITGAERACEELRTLSESFGTDAAGDAYGVHMFMARRESGALEQVRGLVTGEEDPTAHWAPGLLGLYTELRMPAPAARLLHWILDNAVAGQPGMAQWPGVLALLAEAAIWLDDRVAARRLRPLLGEYAGLNLQIGAFDGVFGSADRYLAGLESVLHTGCPEELFGSALEMDTRMRAPVHQAHTLALHLDHLRRRGDSGPHVTELTAQARAIAEPLGLTRILRMLSPAPGLAGKHHRAGRPAQPPTRRDGLTPREIDVLVLLGEGLSNSGIAARLVISENTAANHVRNILAKTGSRNRTQAAMYGRTHDVEA